MKLRIQLLMAGALTLVLPVIAYWAILQIDTALRQDRFMELQERVRAAQALVSVSGEMDDINIASSGEDLTELGSSPETVLYAERLRNSIFLDGYDDDWVRVRQPPVHYSFTNVSSKTDDATHASEPGVSIRAAVSATHLYLFLKVRDDRIVFYNPLAGLISTGDHVEIMWHRLGDGDNPVRRYFSAVAAGGVQARYYGERFEGLQPVLSDSSARAVLSVINQGYQIEVRIPRPQVNSRFGFAVMDRDNSSEYLNPGDEFRESSQDTSFAGTLKPSFTNFQTPQTFLVYPSFKLATVISDLVPPGSRLRVFDRAGRLRADVNRLYERNDSAGSNSPQRTNFFNAVLYRFFDWIIQQRRRAEFDPFTPKQSFSLDLDALQSTTGSSVSELPPIASTPRSYLTLDADHVTGTLRSVGNDVGSGGWILAEINENQANAYTRSAMVRIFSLVMAASLLVAFSLLVFSACLTLRIRRLSR